MATIRDDFDALKRQVLRLKEATGRLEERNKQLEKEIHQLKLRGAQSQAGEFDDLIENVDAGVACLIVKTDQEMDPPMLRSLTDKLKKPNLAMFLMDPRGFCVAASGDSVRDRIPAREMIKVATGVAGGSGGGRPEMAQGRVEDPSKFPDIKQKEKEFITEKAKG
ncbi:MAG: DHHA1 domain-containing protein [Candidatus Omnitrophica bacterium]|nr:DHHA1 domain-containing protein [Candidatus Omnitrophota bacterium]